MTILNTRSTIVDRLQEAVKMSAIHPEMILELESVREGTNPRDIIGLRWSDLMMGRFDTKPMDELVAIFNEMA